MKFLTKKLAFFFVPPLEEKQNKMLRLVKFSSKVYILLISIKNIDYLSSNKKGVLPWPRSELNFAHCEDSNSDVETIEAIN